MTRIASLAFLIVSLTMSNHRGLERPASEADLLRAFAFSSCVAKGYPKTPFGEDAERAADIYMQGGKVGGDAYARMTRTIPDDLEKTSLYDGQKLVLMKCLEFYESPRLKELARRTAVNPGGK